MRARAVPLLACLALPALAPPGAGAEDRVTVIRGTEVSVAKPIETQRALDGTPVEILRGEPLPDPPPRARREPEREIVVIAVPSEPRTLPVGIPIGWWPRWGWHPRDPGHAAAHPPRGLHPRGRRRPPVRNVVHRP